MPVIVTWSSQMAAEAREFYAKELLYHAVPNMVHNKAGFARKTTIPRHNGAKAVWRRMNRLSPALTPLTEGVTPGPSSMTITRVEKDVEQYGNYLAFSDRVSIQSIDELLAENSELLGINAAETIDLVARSEYIKTTNVVYAGTHTQNSEVTASDVINDNEILKIRRALARTNTRRFGNAESGMYFGICHPDVMLDLMKTDVYKQTGIQQNKSQLEQGRMVDTYGIRWHETTEAYTLIDPTSGVHLYYSLIFGPDAFGSVDIADLDLEMIFKGLGSGGTADPLNQRQTQGQPFSKQYLAA